MQWIVGAFFYDDKTMVQANVYPTCIGNVCSPGISPNTTTGFQRTKSYSGYAEGTYAVRPSTRITLGIRYTSDEKNLTGTLVPLPGFPTSFPGPAFPPSVITSPQQAGIATDVSYGKPTWKAVVAQDLSDDIHTYVSYNRGVKSGGFNPTSFTNPASRPEVLDDYEIGGRPTRASACKCLART